MFNIIETKTAAMEKERKTTVTPPVPTKLKRSDTEKEFQETKLEWNEKHSEKYLDKEMRNIERKSVSRSFDNENSFQNHYNHSFRTFGQRRREDKKRSSTQPSENRYYQQTLEYDDYDGVHF